MKRALMSEAMLQMNVVALLNSYARHDIEWHHVPNGVVLPWKVAKELKRLGLTPGVADLMFLIDGQSIAVELKTEIGTQSAEQEAWQERHERAGGKYFIAFGLDQAIGTLKGIGAFRDGVTFSVPKLTANAFAGRVARSPVVSSPSGGRALIQGHQVGSRCLTRARCRSEPSAQT